MVNPIKPPIPTDDGVKLSAASGTTVAAVVAALSWAAIEIMDLSNRINRMEERMNAYQDRQNDKEIVVRDLIKDADTRIDRLERVLLQNPSDGTPR